MIRFANAIVCTSLVLARFAPAEEAVVERKPLAIQSYVDFGQVVQGSNPDQTSAPLEFVPIQRTGISVTQEAMVKNRLNIRIGVGGLFWYAWPQVPGQAHTQIVRFGPGISAANGTFKFGDLENPWMTSQFGFFPYKYNPDAMNLGEYLYRSTAYPGLLYTGGWSFANSAVQKATGARFGFSQFNGAFTHDVTVFFESDTYPVNSISPGWVGALKLGKFFEIGAGAVYQHLIPMKPSALTPKKPLSTYVKVDNLPATVADSGLFVLDGKQIPNAELHPAHAAGPVQGIEQVVMEMKDANGKNPYLAVSNGVDTQYVTDPNVVPAGYQFLYPRSKEYLTFQGLKIMGRVAFDLKPLLSLEDALGPKDIRIYAEAAILGVENQPFYYEDVAKRIPFMAGINLPAFKQLDVLAFQVEYYGLDFRSSEEQSFVNNLPVYPVPMGNAYLHSLENRDKDNWKWSAYARRSLFAGINLFAQVASDHLRLQDFNARRSAEPVVNRPSEWYYLVRFEFGI